MIHNVGPLNALKTEGKAVVKIAGKQVLVIETKSKLYALDNRCPHQGYPLSEGSLKKECTLSCNWHGWTFDLESGDTIQGRDPVQVYPVERRREDIWLDLSPKPRQAMIEKVYQDFQEAMQEHDYARIARVLCRAEKLDEPYEKLAIFTVNWSADKFDAGIGHAHAGLADWIVLSQGNENNRLIAFLEAIGHFSWDSLGHSETVVPQYTEWNKQNLAQAISDMDQELALGLCLAAFDEGLGFHDLKSIFSNHIFSHYAGFGHAAIYLNKAEELLRLLGQEIEQTLCMQMAQYLCNAAREDQLPEFRKFHTYLKMGTLENGTPPTIEFSGHSVSKCMEIVIHTHESPIKLWEALVRASALNMLKFNDDLQHGIEQPIAKNIGWLDFTHALTFAEAVYIHANENPDHWKSGLLQMACFVGRNKPYLSYDRYDELYVENKDVFWAAMKADLFNMDCGEYIYSVHRLKMVRAVEHLVQLVSDNTANILIAALNRYLKAHMRHKSPARVAYQARQLVGKE